MVYYLRKINISNNTQYIFSLNNGPTYPKLLTPDGSSRRSPQILFDRLYSTFFGMAPEIKLVRWTGEKDEAYG